MFIACKRAFNRTLHCTLRRREWKGVHDAMPARRFAESTKAKPTGIKIAHPCVDGPFQFGFEDPTALKGFLNSVLSLPENQQVAEVEHITRDLLPDDLAKGYKFTVDVRCRTDKGQFFLVEMQNDFRSDYQMKALVEHCRMISQLDDKLLAESNSKREFWKKISGVFTVVVTNKRFSATSKKKTFSKELVMEPFLVNTYELRHTRALGRHYGDVPVQITLLMLANFHKSVRQLKSPLEKWAYVFKDAVFEPGSAKGLPVDRLLNEEEVDVLKADPGIERFIDRLDMNKIPESVRVKYIENLEELNAFGEEERRKGREEGRKERRSIVERMVKQKLSTKVIATALGLSEDELKDSYGDIIN